MSGAGLSPSDLARVRLRAQRLTGPPYPDPVAAVSGLLAVQAQDWGPTRWSLAQRLGHAPGAGDAIDAALDDGRVLRTHLMRPTWHLVARDDLRWLLALTADRVHRANAANYRTHRVDAALVAASRAVMRDALDGGRAMTRDDLVARLAASGITAAGTGLSSLLMHAELEGVLVSGPRRDGRQTYALLDDRVPPSPPVPRDEALARLAARYVGGHGPATAADLGWWSGLTLADARRGLAASGLETVEVDGTTHWLDPASAAPPTAEPGPTVHLASAYDEVVVAFRDRRVTHDPAGLDIPIARAENGLLPPVLVDGRVVGHWRRDFSPRRLSVEVAL